MIWYHIYPFNIIKVYGKDLEFENMDVALKEYCEINLQLIFKKNYYFFQKFIRRNIYHFSKNVLQIINKSN